MLDNELTGTVDNDAGRFDTTDPTIKAPPAPRRRRSAGRPAGPPVADEAAPGVTTPVAAALSAEEKPAKAPAKKAAATRSRKKAEPAPAEATAELDEAEKPAKAPAKKAAATRSRKKAAAPVDPPPAVLPEPVEDVEDVEAEDDGAEASAVAAPATMLLFQAPSAEAAPPRRRRAAGRAAGQPAPAEAAEPATTAAELDADSDSDSDSGSDSDTATDGGAPPAARRRRRRAGTSAEARTGSGTTEDAQLTEDFYGDAEGSDGADGADPEGSEGEDGPDGEGGGPNRRRRRRGGRGRRGRGGREGGPGEDGEESADAGDEAAPEGNAEAGTEADDFETGETGEGGTRRRRRRRRRGEDGDGGPDDPEQTVTRVRTPRQSDRQSDRGDRGGSDRASDGVTSVRGSTRLEAKKQRRREGREAGRSRVPIATEAEFLARREAVERVMVVREGSERTQIAVLEDGVLVEHYVNKRESSSLMGDVFLGRVQNVLPSMEAAFVDIGKGRNAVLYAGEVNFDGMGGQPKRIEHALKSGQSVLVQVTKDPVGHKGARLTSQISLPGRYLVYVPEGSMTGISRKLPDNERARLKAILKKVVPEDAGVIIRTAAEGASEAELAADVERLATQWEAIKKKAKTATSPALLHGEPDLTIRVVRDIFNSDFGSLVVAGEAAWKEVSEYVKNSAPDLAERVTHWAGPEDAFAAHRIDEQILKGLDRKVWLPSGGSLVIDRTEAMTVVDVNTGKFTGQGGNLEETVTRNNLEAAEEIVRQLRLRDIGGIIVVDFIDMVLESNRELVLRRLIENLGRDRTKHQVAEVTSLGLVQMTRKKVGQGLLEAFSATCEHCNGRGIIVRTDQQAKAPGIPKPGPGGPPAPREAADADAPGGSRSARRRRGRGKGGADEGAADTETDPGVPDEALALEAESADRPADAAPVLAAAEFDDPTAPAPTGTGAVSVATERATEPANGAVTASADDPDAADAPEAAPKRTRKRKPASSPQQTVAKQPAEPEPASV